MILIIIIVGHTVLECNINMETLPQAQLKKKLLSIEYMIFLECEQHCVFSLLELIHDVAFSSQYLCNM